MGHKFVVAAFLCTWVIQGGYLLLLVSKWNRLRAKSVRQAAKSVLNK